MNWRSIGLAGVCIHPYTNIPCSTPTITMERTSMEKYAIHPTYEVMNTMKHSDIPSPTIRKRKFSGQHEFRPLSPLLKRLSIHEEIEMISWPMITDKTDTRRAILCLEKAKQHAKYLIQQHQYERACTMLAKVEQANEKVCQRRRHNVIEQANSIENMKSIQAASNQTRRVHFHTEIMEFPAIEMDRFVCRDDIKRPLRQEMLVLRASSQIPLQNFSEFWS